MIVNMSPVKPRHGLNAAETLALALIMEDRLSTSPGSSLAVLPMTWNAEDLQESRQPWPWKDCWRRNWWH